ncbi:amino acid permease [Methylocystis parvus]|uniref:Amino acid permease n=1 Tax=Methylocystis parvus TaxID=134 RepID=A0A6B8MBJ3_9HYPH|nr:amino acid permease [Methylocystis parvus]QGM97990.1 amino acid permease [Methylocystis parvus]WBK01695.1 amino acid permease [Methylocystis parvus OBBP]
MSYQDFTRVKSIESLRAEAGGDKSFRRVLGVWQLTGIGLGGLIGVGIFVLTGVVAANQAGPAVALSFLIAGVASGAAALSYAEFAGLIPVAGSAYTYAYAALGELVAWIIGWDLLLEYALVVAVVSIGWSGYLQSLLSQLGLPLPDWAAGAAGTGPGRVVDVLAALGALGVAALLTLRIEWGARFNSAMVILKIAAALFVIAVGLPYVRVENWTPFMPFGFSGVAEGAAIVFFAVFGYDTLTTAAEEARDPQRDLPRAVLLSLAVSLTLYVAMALVLTGIVRYDALDSAAPVVTAFKAIGLPWVAFIVSVAAVAGITSVMLAFLLGCARIWFAMSRDGLLPEWFAVAHPRFRTPHRPTLIAGALTAIVAALYPIREVAELVNIGTLSAFVVISLAIIVLRKTQPDAPRTFRTPFVPFTPLAGVGFSIWLLSRLPLIAWERFLIWMAIGLAIYFLYGRRRSKLARAPSKR